MSQQNRIFKQLSKSMNNFLQGNIPLEGMLLDLEANLGVIEDKDLKVSISEASNLIDECINIYDGPAGKRRAKKIIKKLLSEIKSRGRTYKIYYHIPGCFGFKSKSSSQAKPVSDISSIKKLILKLKKIGDVIFVYDIEKCQRYSFSLSRSKQGFYQIYLDTESAEYYKDVNIEGVNEFIEEIESILTDPESHGYKWKVISP